MLAEVHDTFYHRGMTGPVATLPAGTTATHGGTAGTEHRPPVPASSTSARAEQIPFAMRPTEADAAEPTGNAGSQPANPLAASLVETPATPDVEKSADALEAARQGAPRAAEALGLGDRYRYLTGTSGRRYLFSGVDLDALEDFRNAVVVIGLGEGRPESGHARRVWIGEIDRDGIRRGPALPRALSRAAEEARGTVLVHLLAGHAAERREVLEDLAAGLARAGLETLSA